MSKGNLYKRGQTYWLRVTVARKEYRCTLRTDSREVAERRATDEIKRLKAEAHFGEATVTWKQAIIMWGAHIIDQVGPKTAKRYMMSLKMCEPWLAPHRIDQINGKVIAGLITERRKTGATPATIRRDLTAISSVLKWGEGQNLCEGNPTLSKRQTLKERRDPIALPDQADIDHVIAEAGPRFGAYIKAALMTGCRQGELAAVRRKDFSAVARTLKLHGKGNKRRTITLSEEATAHFSAQPAGIASALIFTRNDGGALVRPDSDFNNLRQTIITRAEKEKREFRRFRFHDLRHLYAVRELETGRSIYAVSKHMGHTSVKTTEIYLDFLTPERQEEVKASAQNLAQMERFADNAK